MEEINPNPCTRSSSSSCMLEKKSTRPPKEQLNCPRCKSSNTKFCYYNNYSLTQPRYFCKSCRRYWTEGGSLRNVPVGGGSRKNRKPSTTTTAAMSSSSSSSNSTDHYFHTQNNNNSNPKLPNYPSSQFSTQNPVGRDLNLAFPCGMSHFVEVPKVENVNNDNCGGIGNFRGLSSFIPNLMPNSNNNNNNNASLGIDNGPFPSGFSLPHDEFKPSLGINSVDGLGDGRNLLAFQELNQHSSAAPNESDHQNQRQQGTNISTGYWSGMLGGGSL